jgi:hypothetical protein
VRRLKMLVLRLGAWVSERFPGGYVAKPDPAKPLVAEWHWATPGEHGQRLFVFLPGRRDRASDFGRRGFITLAQRRIPGLDCVAVDATLGYYVNGSLADRLQREIIDPASAVGYREIWLVGDIPGNAIHRRTFIRRTATFAGATAVMSIVPRRAFAADTPTMVNSIRSLSNPYHATWNQGGQAFAKSIGAEYVTLVTEGDSEKGIADIRAILAKTGGNMVLNVRSERQPGRSADR